MPVTADARQPTLEDLLSALRHSHDRLITTVTPLGADGVTAPSYDTGWSIAHVLSHLGSGAEIFTMFLDAGLRGEPSPAIEQFHAVWDRWNAKTPQDQARDSLTVDAAFLDRIEGLTPAERESWRMSLFGADQRLPDVAKMRLAEHALHSWDIAVALDDEATVAPDAVELIIDNLDTLVARAGKPAEQPAQVQVTTSDPHRTFLLTIDADGARLQAAESHPASGGTALELTAEAFIRLVYGRLDEAHTPPFTSMDVDLDTLRRAFPGV